MTAAAHVDLIARLVAATDSGGLQWDHDYCDRPTTYNGEPFGGGDVYSFDHADRLLWHERPLFNPAQVIDCPEVAVLRAAAEAQIETRRREVAR